VTRGWLAAFALASVGAGAVALVMQREVPAGQGVAQSGLRRADKPTLALLTSLPLVFGERFSIEGGGSPTLTRLERRYRVSPLAVADSRSLKGHRLLLMAHPRAQPAEALVELDAWVRRGGRVLLLADPKLDWHSNRPLGDPLRPPPDFADTGLLAHWGLGLDGPVVDGPRFGEVGGYDVMTASPGVLRSRSRGCTVEGGGLMAHCRVGRGGATVIADADFLNVEGEGALDGPTQHNLDLLIAELGRLESR
jgi:hypothetical protein